MPLLRHPELERELFEQPDDLGAWAVYGDWLAAQGDPRGELIQLELAIEAGVSLTPELRRRYAALMVEERPRWVGPELLAMLDEPDASRSSCIEWRRGHLLRARVLGAGSQSAAERLRALLASPTVMMLRRLEVSLDAERDDLQAVGPALFEGCRLDSLRELELDAWTFRRGEGPPLVDLRFAWQRAWPRLEQLALRALHVELGEIRHDRLRSLQLSTRHGVELEPLRSLASAELPSLRRLSLFPGRLEPGLEPAYRAVLGDLLDMAGRVGLTHLSIVTCDQPDIALDRLAHASALRSSLERLGLAYGLLGDEHVDPLLAALRPYTRLRSLDLGWNYLPPAALQAIEVGLGGRVELRSDRQKHDRGPDTREIPVFGRYGVAETTRGEWD